MICESFKALDDEQRAVMQAKILHLFQCSEKYNKQLEIILRWADYEDEFKNVLFGREALMNEPVLASDTKG